MPHWRGDFEPPALSPRAPHYEQAKDEVAAKTDIPPPRRPQLRIYEPGRDQPRDVLVFRR